MYTWARAYDKDDNGYDVPSGWKIVNTETNECHDERFNWCRDARALALTLNKNVVKAEKITSSWVKVIRADEPEMSKELWGHWITVSTSVSNSMDDLSALRNNCSFGELFVVADTLQASRRAERVALFYALTV